MATNPFSPSRHTDNSRTSERIQTIMETLNTGARQVNQNVRNVPPRYQYFPLRKYATTFDGLPAAVDAGPGAQALVTDSQVKHADGLGQIIDQGGGLYSVPVYAAFDGDTGYTNWVIG